MRCTDLEWEMGDLTLYSRALLRTGINAKGANGYESQFGMNLSKRLLVNISTARALMTSIATTSLEQPIDIQSLMARSQDFIGNSNGEFDMWAGDTSTQIIEQPAIYMMASNMATTSKKPFVEDAKLGLCQVINGEVDVSPDIAATQYFVNSGINTFDFSYLNEKPRLDTAFKVLQEPMHGQLVQRHPDATDFTKYQYQYVPSAGYAGYDNFIFLVSAGGESVKVYYTMAVMHPGEPTYALDENGKQAFNFSECPSGSLWKISRVQSHESGVNDLAAWQRASDLSAFLANASQSLAGFSDLASTAVGETTGEGLTAKITLDTNAAGHSWYVDPTPLDNSDDYLPTSDPTVFRARAGSAAEGKMDMLSVLLHEYGHALGLEHSGNGADFMAASLQPGVRKLPSAAELTLMSQLVAELKGANGEALTLALSQGEREQDNPFAPSPLSALGLLPFGLMRRNVGKGSANAALTTGAATALGSGLPSRKIRRAGLVFSHGPTLAH